MTVSEVLEIQDKVMDKFLKEIVESNSKCAKCVFNHNNICFFAYKCVTTDFSYQKECDNQ